MLKSLDDFLNTKPLYYDEIDYTRMPRVYNSIKSQMKLPKIIHVVGTNGKGTTGRFLATALTALSYKTGHYTSPHILNFSERIWLNSQDVSASVLENAHIELFSVLKEEDADSLSYFEYTTLLAMWIFQDLEYVVLEAGLGGEFDATSVFKNIVTMVTPIAKDHEVFLGTTLKDIATTKLKAVQKKAILSQQKYENITTVLVDNNIDYSYANAFIDKDDKEKISEISKDLSLVDYLKENLTTSIATLKYLGISYEAKHFSNARLFGRLSRYRKNIILDVGHNELAAEVILQSLRGNKYILVYNTYADKNYKAILSILKPLIKSVEIIEIVDKRVEKRALLQKTLKELDIVSNIFHNISEEKNYLVFGSFLVVEAFLKGYRE